MADAKPHSTSNPRPASSTERPGRKGDDKFCPFTALLWICLMSATTGGNVHMATDIEEHSIGGARPQRKSAEWERAGAGTADRIRWTEPDRELWVLNDGLVDGSPEKCLAPGRVGGRDSHPPLGRVTVSWVAGGANVS